MCNQKSRNEFLFWRVRRLPSTFWPGKISSLDQFWIKVIWPIAFRDQIMNFYIVEFSKIVYQKFKNLEANYCSLQSTLTLMQTYRLSSTQVSNSLLPKIISIQEKFLFSRAWKSQNVALQKIHSEQLLKFFLRIYTFI